MQNNKELPKGRVDNVDRLVSKRLRMRRVMLGLSQYDISRAIDVSVQQVQKYEKAINRISSGKLHILAKFLKVPVEYFFEKITSDFVSDSLAFNEETPNSDGSVDNMDSKSVLNKEPVPEKEIFSLIRAFSDIKDQNRRKKIIELTKALV